MEDPNPESIRGWWEQYIQHQRDEEAHSQRGGVGDYSSPCQVEVFWMSEPIEGQAIIVTHDPDRPDLEIIVNGPFEGTNFIEEVAEIAKQDRWQRTVPPQDYKSPPDRQPIREDVLADVISTLTGQLEQSIYSDFSPWRIPFIRRSILWVGSFSCYVIGNVTDWKLGEDDAEEANTGDSNGDAEEEVDSETADSGSNNQQQEVEPQPAGGGFIYPAVWVDASPERSFSEKVWGVRFRESEIVFRDTILDDEFIAFRDGLLFLLNNDGDKILNVLNTFFGIGIFDRFFQWRALQPRELVSGRIGPDGLKTSHLETSTPSGRNQMYSGESRPPDYERGLIRSPFIEWLLRVTEVVFPISDLRERIMLHLQAHTRFTDDEYTSSFLLNWTVSEQHISKNLKINHPEEYVDSKNASQMVDLFHEDGFVNKNGHQELHRHRIKRNSIVHDMDTASREESEDIDHLVSELLVREVNSHLEETEIAPVRHRPIPMKPTTRHGDYNPVKW